jgi:hypothetical protein
LARPAERIVAFYNQRGTAEQWIKEGKGAIKWTRLSCRTFAANAVCLQLHALAYNLGNFVRTLAMPKAAECGQSSAVQRLGTVNRLLHSPFAPLNTLFRCIGRSKGRPSPHNRGESGESALKRGGNL